MAYPKLLALLALALPLGAFAANPIQTENQLPGTTAWQITNPSTEGQIQGYTGEDSVNAGQKLDLYVSTAAKSYTVQVYRLGYYQGLGGALKLTMANQPGLNQGYWTDSAYPSDQVDTRIKKRSIVSYFVPLLLDGALQLEQTHLVDANWQETSAFIVPTAWVSGLYIIKLTENDTGTQWHVPFVVRNDASTSALICEEPFNTEEAYNPWGGGDAYYLDRAGQTYDHSCYISYNRPYALDHGAALLFETEYEMVRFMEEEGYDVSYTTNIGIESGLTTLNNHKGLVVGGHDEYVSQDELYKIESAVENGMSAAYFTGNQIYWQVRHMPDLSNRPDRFMLIFKGDLPAPYVQHVDPVNGLGLLGAPYTTELWAAPAVNHPQTWLLKTDYGSIFKAGQTGSFVVHNCGSWVFAGTGLQNGDQIPNVYGDEVQTADYLYMSELPPQESVTVLSSWLFSDYLDEQVTANTVVTENLQSKTIVFDAGSIAWASQLTDYPSYIMTVFPSYPRIGESIPLRAITANVLNHMATAKTGPTTFVDMPHAPTNSSTSPEP